MEGGEKENRRAKQAELSLHGGAGGGGGEGKAMEPLHFLSTMI